MLCREPVHLDSESVGRFLHDRVVLVTGAAGSIGSEICRQILAFRPGQLILLDHSENGLFFLERELRALAPEADIIPCVTSITDAPACGPSSSGTYRRSSSMPRRTSMCR